MVVKRPVVAQPPIQPLALSMSCVMRRHESIHARCDITIRSIKISRRSSRFSSVGCVLMQQWDAAANCVPLTLGFPRCRAMTTLSVIRLHSIGNFALLTRLGETNGPSFLK